jgi:hypothetical protein
VSIAFVVLVDFSRSCFYSSLDEFADLKKKKKSNKKKSAFDLEASVLSPFLFSVASVSPHSAIQQVREGARKRREHWKHPADL